MTNKLHLFFIAICSIIISVYLSSFLGFFPAFAQQSADLKITKVGNPTGPRPGGIGPNGFIWYCQSKAEWSSICAIGYAGCGPTSLAMVFSTFGVTITPPEMDKIFQQHGWRACSKASGSSMGSGGALESQWLKDQGFEAVPLPFITIQGVKHLDLDVAKDLINKGNLIIGSVGTHIFVIDDVFPNDQTIHMQDPDSLCSYPNGVIHDNTRPWGGEFWYYAYAIKKVR